MRHKNHLTHDPSQGHARDDDLPLVFPTIVPWPEWRHLDAIADGAASLAATGIPLIPRTRLPVMPRRMEVRTIVSPPAGILMARRILIGE